jgi:two-component system LytT family response regulator
MGIANMLKLGICDDDLNDIKRIRHILSKEIVSGRYHIKQYTPSELLLDVEEEMFECDILLMDITFKNLEFNGIDLVCSINEKFPQCNVIYCSNCLEYAPYVYKTKHCYFVLKKNMEEMLPVALNKALELYEESVKKDVLLINSQGHKVYIDRKDIKYIERDARKVNIVTTSRTYTSYMSLSELEQTLGSNMVRIHGSFIINLEYVSFIGNETVELTDSIILPLGRTYEKNVRDRYMRFWAR